MAFSVVWWFDGIPCRQVLADEQIWRRLKRIYFCGDLQQQIFNFRVVVIACIKAALKDRIMNQVYTLHPRIFLRLTNAIIRFYC
jgi:hypothetical protein